MGFIDVATNSNLTVLLLSYEPGILRMSTTPTLASPACGSIGKSVAGLGYHGAPAEN